MSADETMELARGSGFIVVLNLAANSVQQGNKAQGVTWTHLVFNKA